jgi:hypothetical protein
MDYKFIMDNKFLVPMILIIFFIIYMSYTMSNKKESLDNVESTPVETAPAVVETAPVEKPAMPEVKADDFKPVAEKLQQANVVNNNYAVVEFPVEKANLTSEDLLPKYDEANDFAKENPVSKLLKEQNFLISGYHAGINTVMQSNKIPYHDLRSAPAIPKQNVGPFLNSSYETFGGSSGRRLFELGA